MIRAIIAVIQGATAGMISRFVVDKSVDVATDEEPTTPAAPAAAAWPSPSGSW